MKYFMMSRRFNKSKPEEFGLIPYRENTYLLPVDNSLWVASEMYDFGWGPENGYYRLPELSFEELFELGNHASGDDMYGAASLILKNYPHELLLRVESIIRNNDTRKYLTLLKVLKLDTAINLSFQIEQDAKDVNSQFERWKAISDSISKL